MPDKPSRMRDVQLTSEANTVLLTTSISAYAGVLIVALMATMLAGFILAASYLVGPKRKQGTVKDDAYESGMSPETDARRRFHVRFYVVAVLFLLFDVEVLLLWPWAPVFTRICRGTESGGLELSTGAIGGPAYLLVAMGLFVALLVVGLFYEWKRGVFRWD